MTWTWRDDARCLGLAPLFDAVIDGETPGSKAQKNRHQQAIDICGTCPVVKQCDASVDRFQDEGVRAGRVLASLAAKPIRGKGGQRLKEIRHGTEAGYRMHLRREEEACEACKVANRVAFGKRSKAINRTRSERLPREHGTERGYQQHRNRNDMPICDACSAAHSAYTVQGKQQKRVRKDDAA